MRALVTGAAGFIGSRVSEALLGAGWSVIGVDAFRTTYDPAIKRLAVRGLACRSGWELVERDLAELDLRSVLDAVDLVVHLSARANARASWHDDFELYLRDNVSTTQRVLAAAQAARVGRVVFASSSSVYGNSAVLPVAEEVAFRPVSPYGATKSMGESVARLYVASGLDVVTVRYFTVYGPCQRPDMAFHRLIDATLRDEHPFELYGDGGQARDFTYVADAVAGTLAAAECGQPGRAYNIGAGAPHSLREAMAVVGELTGRVVPIRQAGVQRGDVLATAADITRARTELGFCPRWTLTDGLARQVAWQQSLASVSVEGPS